MDYGKLLIADDETIFLNVTATLLRRRGYQCHCARDASQALRQLRNQPYDAVIADIRMPGNEDMDFIRKLQKEYPTLPVVVVTGYPSLPTAIKSVRLSVLDYIPKPVAICQLYKAVERALESKRAFHIESAIPANRPSTKTVNLENELRSRYDFKAIVGRHPKMLEILQLVAQVADSDATVLIQGESGTGKELIARALHSNSRSRIKPFVPINCGALSENLLESELFGYAKGAFTGAAKAKSGWLEFADGGSIFLDEVSQMSPALQVKLLRVLQFKEYAPVGSTEMRYCDVRVVAASNQELSKLVDEGKFREDVYYRLNVIDIEVPPLRHRREDIPLLINHFLKIYNHNHEPKRLADEAQILLCSYDYPGNVRELGNAIQRGIALSSGNIIKPHLLPVSIQKTDGNVSRHKTCYKIMEAKRRAAEVAEKKAIIDGLRATQGHITKAARMSGMDVSNYHKIMKKYDLDASQFKGALKSSGGI